jgi:hypothetical protein
MVERFLTAEDDAVEEGPVLQAPLEAEGVLNVQDRDVPAKASAQQMMEPRLLDEDENRMVEISLA